MVLILVISDNIDTLNFKISYITTNSTNLGILFIILYNKLFVFSVFAIEIDGIGIPQIKHQRVKSSKIFHNNNMNSSSSSNSCKK